MIAFLLGCIAGALGLKAAGFFSNFFCTAEDIERFERELAAHKAKLSAMMDDLARDELKKETT